MDIQKEDIDHVEAISAEVHAHLRVAADEELGEGKSPWAVFRQNPRAFGVLVVVLSTAILQGSELSMSGSMTGSQAFCKVMGKWDASTLDYTVPDVRVSAWNAAATPSQFFGYFLAGILSDKFGRKIVVQGSILLILMGAITETVSRNWVDWLGSKIIMGVATGCIMGSATTYVAETSPRELRGPALIGYQFFTNVGNLVSAVALDLSSKRWSDPSNTLQYKIPLYIMIALPPVMSVAVFFMLVESPTWLVMQGSLPQAMKSLQWIYPWMSVEDLELEVAKLQYTIEKEKEESGDISWLECFQGTNLRRTMVAMVPPLAWVMGGNVMYILSAYFFSIAGQTNSLQSTVIVQCSGIAVNIITALLVENQHVGRWLMLVVGTFIQSGGMFMIGAAGAAFGAVPTGKTLAGNLIVAGLVISNVGCQFGPQGVSYVYASESGSTRLRAKTTSVAMSVGSFLGQITAIIFPFMLTAWGTLVAFFFAGFGVIFLVISLIWVPDYTGRSHAQLDELYVRKVAARKFTSTTCTGDYGRDVLQES